MDVRIGCIRAASDGFRGRGRKMRCIAVIDSSSPSTIALPADPVVSWNSPIIIADIAFVEGAIEG